MKAHEAIILFTPNVPCYAGRETVGQIKVIRMPAGGRYGHLMEGFACDFGAGIIGVSKLRGLKSAMKLYADFNSLVVGACLDPKAVHREFLKIDEYVKYAALDLPGVEARLCELEDA